MSNFEFREPFASDYSNDRLTDALMAFDNLKWRIENIRDWLKLYDKEYNWQSDMDMENHIKMAHVHAEDIVQALQDIRTALGWYNEDATLYEGELLQ